MSTAATDTSVPETSKTSLWSGRVITTLVVLFLVFDGVMKLVKEVHSRIGTIELGFAESALVPIGVTVLACALVYVIPRTSVLGAILLSGYLGGAVAVQVRVGHPVFECAFPIIFCMLAWLGIFLREPRLRVLVPFKTPDRPLS